MTVPEARKQERLRRYPLRRHRLPVAGGTLSIVAPDSGEWLHRGGWSTRAQLGAEPPYWADVWPASVAAARWLARRRDLEGVRVLDLGCGIGVAGCGALLRGAKVTFADLEADALAFAEFNGLATGAGRERIDLLQLDWHRQTAPAGFDLLLLADVTYRPVHHGPIRRHLEQCLAPGGLVLHCDPHRADSDSFLRSCELRLARHMIPTDAHFGERRVPMRITLMATDAEQLERWLPAATKSSPAPVESGDRRPDP